MQSNKIKISKLKSDIQKLETSYKDKMSNLYKKINELEFEEEVDRIKKLRRDQ